MAKVTGIDIGSTSIKLVEIDGSNRKWRVQRVVSYPRSVPQEAEDDSPPPSERELLLTDLKAAWHDSGATRDRAMLAVSASQCILRTMSLPFRGRDEIRKVLKFEAEGHIHSHSIEDVVVDALTVEERKDGTEMFLVACPKEQLGEDIKLIQKTGCDPEWADLGAALLVSAADELGVFAAPVAVEGESSAPEDDSGEAPVDLVIDLGASSVQLIVVRGGQLATVRCLRWGLSRYITIDSSGEPRQDMAQSKEIAGRILREAQRFLSGLGLDTGARRIFVSGGGARWPGLPEAIASAAGTTVEILDLLARASSTEGEGGDCDIALAAAVAGLNSSRRTFNFRQEELAFRPKFDRLKLPLAIALLIGTVLLFGLAFSKLKTIQRLESQIGVTVEDPKRKSRTPKYRGLMLPLLQPDRRARIKGRLRPEHASQVLEGAAKQTVVGRSRWVRRELDKIKLELQKKTGVYSEIQNESGLSVLQRFSEIIAAAEANEKVGRFMVLTIDLVVGAKRKVGGKLTFRMAFRGDNYIAQNAAFDQIVQEFVTAKNTPFESAKYEGQTPWSSAFEKGGEFTYVMQLVPNIPILQN